MKENPKFSAKKLSELLEISSRAVEKQIASLETKGLLKRAGSPKGGHWEVNGLLGAESLGEGVADKTGASVASEDLGARGRLSPLKIKNKEEYHETFNRNRHAE